jgi:precorrin isomerase
MASMFMKAVVAIGNAPVTKAIGNLMAGISDVKQVIGTILGSFLSPAAKASLKVSKLSSFIEKYANSTLL